MEIATFLCVPPWVAGGFHRNFDDTSYIYIKFNENTWIMSLLVNACYYVIIDIYRKLWEICSIETSVTKYNALQIICLSNLMFW